MNAVTQLLQAIHGGDPKASSELLPLVYHELRQLAAQKLAQEKPGQTLQATALVHEAYLRLVGENNQTIWNSRGHFFAAASEAIRRILIENARRKKRIKHGGSLARVDMEFIELPTRMTSDELIELDDALKKLQEVDAVKARLVTLRYFGGMTIEEASEALGISRGAAHRHWQYARAWLHRQVTQD